MYRQRRGDGGEADATTWSRSRAETAKRSGLAQTAKSFGDLARTPPHLSHTHWHLLSTLCTNIVVRYQETQVVKPRESNGTIFRLKRKMRPGSITRPSPAIAGPVRFHPKFVAHTTVCSTGLWTVAFPRTQSRLAVVSDS